MSKIRIWSKVLGAVPVESCLIQKLYEKEGALFFLTFV